MWEHVLFNIAHRVETITTSRFLDDPQYAAQVVSGYSSNQTGPLTGFEYLSFEKIPKEYRCGLSPTAETALNQFPAD